jgi:hypothetical protein
MSLDFPANPVDGQVYLGYVYDATVGAWQAGSTRLQTPVPVTLGGTGASTLAAAQDNLGVGLVPIVPSSVVVSGSGASASANSLGKVTFSNAATISFNGIFTSAYANYRFLLSANVASSAAQISARMRASGTDNAGLYVFGGSYTRVTGGSPTGFASASSTAFPIIICNATASGPMTTVGEIMSPAETKSTTINMNGYWADSVGALGMNVNALHASSSAFDGLSMVTGVLSGTIQFFGYNE